MAVAASHIALATSFGVWSSRAASAATTTRALFLEFSAATHVTLNASRGMKPERRAGCLSFCQEKERERGARQADRVTLMTASHSRCLRKTIGERQVGHEEHHLTIPCFVV